MLTLSCAGCGATVSAWDPAATPFACPHAKPGDDIDHVMRPVSDVTCPFPAEGDANPFVLYRQLLASHARATDAGIGDEAFLRIARELDEAVARVDGRGVRVTPFTPSRSLAEAVGITSGELWVKDETGQVAGSHKARHLVGIMLHLLVEARRSDGARAAAGRSPLAIASCGNAALAAAVVARAADWPLEVFVPPDAHERVVRRLAELSASIHVCERDGRTAGDPCHRAFRQAVSAQAGSPRHGAIPFCCQGSDNGLTIEGGKTIAWEMVSSFRSRPVRQWGASRLDAVFVQVGGGALASAIVQGFDDAVAARSLDRPPRIHTVQTTGAYPLKRAYDEVAERILALVPLVLDQGFSPASDRERAELIVTHPELIDEGMRHARAHRSQFMRPWEKTPRSLAHGILDDETYDWAAVVEGMLRTGGWPLVVGEERLMEANRIAREATGIDVDHTGSAGLAGLMKAVTVDPRLASERVAVVFSGVRRG
jgi:threonine synthase